MRNIAIMGSSGGSGKDTVARIINELSGNKYSIDSLGGPIHKAADDFVGGKAKREYLQQYGEAVRKIFGEDVWIKQVDKKVRKNRDNGLGTIIPDVRKMLEFAHFGIEKKFLPIYVCVSPRVARERLVQRDGGYEEKSMQDGIEKQMRFIESLPAVSYQEKNFKMVDLESGGALNQIAIINNDGSLNELKYQLEDWWEVFGKE